MGKWKELGGEGTRKDERRQEKTHSGGRNGQYVGSEAKTWESGAVTRGASEPGRGWPVGRGRGRWAAGRLLHRGQLDLLLQFHHVFPEEAVGVHQILDGLAGVNDGGVVTAAEMFADGFEGVFGECFGQVHSNLPRLNDFSFAGFLQ